jgi:transcriptional regulator with XRE-family HTH domain
MAEVGNKVRELREWRGWTQAQLGVYAGLSPATVNLIEHGHRNPNMTTLAKLARVLEVEPGVFFEEPEVPKADAPPLPAESIDEERRELIERVVDFLGWRPPDVEQRAEAYRDAMLKAVDDVVQQAALERVERNRRFVDDPDQVLRVERRLSSGDSTAEDAKDARGA